MPKGARSLRLSGAVAMFPPVHEVGGGPSLLSCGHPLLSLRTDRRQQELEERHETEDDPLQQPPILPLSPAFRCRGASLREGGPLERGGALSPATKRPGMPQAGEGPAAVAPSFQAAFNMRAPLTSVANTDAERAVEDELAGVEAAVPQHDFTLRLYSHQESSVSPSLASVQRQLQRPSRDTTAATSAADVGVDTPPRGAPNSSPCVVSAVVSPSPARSQGGSQSLQQVCRSLPFRPEAASALKSDSTSALHQQQWEEPLLLPSDASLQPGRGGAAAPHGKSNDSSLERQQQQPPTAFKGAVERGRRESVKQAPKSPRMLSSSPSGAAWGLLEISEGPPEVADLARQGPLDAAFVSGAATAASGFPKVPPSGCVRGSSKSACCSGPPVATTEALNLSACKANPLQPSALEKEGFKEKGTSAWSCSGLALLDPKPLRRSAASLKRGLTASAEERADTAASAESSFADVRGAGVSLEAPTETAVHAFPAAEGSRFTTPKAPTASPLMQREGPLLKAGESCISSSNRLWHAHTGTHAAGGFPQSGRWRLCVDPVAAALRQSGETQQQQQQQPRNPLFRGAQEAVGLTGPSSLKEPVQPPVLRVPSKITPGGPPQWGPLSPLRHSAPNPAITGMRMPKQPLTPSSGRDGHRTLLQLPQVHTQKQHPLATTAEGGEFTPVPPECTWSLHVPSACRCSRLDTRCNSGQVRMARGPQGSLLLELRRCSKCGGFPLASFDYGRGTPTKSSPP
ncbi:hypothetical protein cyc_05470 [Cyclospora cayetanensis]|uniref:Uncharacterized protein n=1 Tax=Cyclospora cayetanensis TaxID=88456 RepID=A0A1D3DB45_9EIME|nr:hypothetical protein cyc_05470 [Cyclospora cayetanensis]